MKIKKKMKEINKAEHCPWYETLGRILFMLIMAAGGYALFVKVLIIILRFFGEQVGLWEEIYDLAQSNPVAIIVLSCVGYIIFLIAFIYNFTRSLLNSITQV